MRRILRVLLPLALLLILASLCGSATASRSRAMTCRMPNVIGLSAQAARARIKSAGCTGTIFRTTHCLADTSRFKTFIGRVTFQRPRARAVIPNRQAVDITVGVSGSSSECQHLTPPSQPEGFGSLDGSWTGTYTVQQSSNPLAQPGQKLTGISFTVKNGALGGDLSGTISSAGYLDPNGTGVTKYDAQVTASIDGLSCHGTVSFWMYDHVGQAAAEAPVMCGDIAGQFIAKQNQ